METTGDHRRPTAAAVLLLAGGAAAAAAAWGVSRTGAIDDRVFHASAIAAFVVAYVALGVHTWWSGRSRLGLLMVGIGFLVALATLTYWTAAAPSTIGRVVTAALPVYIAYVFLCFPRDRLHGAADRRVIGGFLVASLLLWAAALLIVEPLPPGGPFYDCAGDACRRNALNVVDTSSGTASAMGYLIDVVTAVALGAVGVLLVLKCLSPSRLRRRALVPLAVCFAVWVAARSVFILLREAGVDTGLGVLKPTVAAAALALPVAMYVGQRRGGLLAGRRLATLIAALGVDRVSPATLEAFMRDALGDPRLRFLLWQWEGDGYVDADGAAAELPAAHGSARVAEVTEARGRPRAAVVYDAALADSVELVDGLARTSLLILDNDRLVGELAASRTRIASAAARERVRLERDLHDGAQQRLIGLKFALASLRDDADPELRAGLEVAAGQADLAIDDLRRLSQGIYPPVLVEGGVATALRSVAGTAPVHVEVRDGNVGRSTAPVEYAVYLCAVEAIQNAIKHGGPGVRVDVHLEARDGELHFSIADDGPGFDVAATERRSGLTNMRDRIGSVGGVLTVTSARDAGATVYGAVPYPVDSGQPQ